MQIYPISSLNTNNHSLTLAPVFKAHPDFYKSNSIRSCYFRRGAVCLMNKKGYSNIENLFLNIFEQYINSLKKMLIIGIGRSQETFSYSATIKGIIGNHQLNKNLDLYTVDMQSKPEQDELWYDSFSDLLDYQSFPKYAGKCFVKDKKFTLKVPDISISPLEYLVYINKQTLDLSATKNTDYDYRVNDEIFNFIKNTYDNPQKSKWDSRIQDVISEYPDEYFDIISANNVLGHIQSDSEYFHTLKHIVRILKKQRDFITDPYKFSFDMLNEIAPNKFKRISAGIFRKVED